MYYVSILKLKITQTFNVDVYAVISKKKNKKNHDVNNFEKKKKYVILLFVCIKFVDQSVCTGCIQ